MKRKKWLIIITFVLLSINVFFYLIQHIGKQDYIKSRLISFIEKKYQIKVNFSEYEMNDKKISFIDLKATKDDFKINIPRIDLEYNIFNFIFAQLLYKTKLNSLIIYSPSISINISKPNFDKSSAFKFNIQKFKSYFKELYITDAQIDFFYETDKFSYQETFSKLNFSLNKNNELDFQTKTYSLGDINIKAILNNNSINNPQINIKNYKPQKLVYEGNPVSFILNSDFFKDKEIYYKVLLQEIAFSIDGNNFFSSELNIKGKDFGAFIEDKEIIYNAKYKFSFYSNLENLNKKKIIIKEMSLYDQKFKGNILLNKKETKLNLEAENFLFQKKDNLLKGNLNTEINFSKEGVKGIISAVDINYENNYFSLNNFSLKANLFNSQINLFMENSLKNINFSLEGDLAKQNFEAKANINNLNFADIIKDSTKKVNAIISLNSDLSFRKGNLSIKNNLYLDEKYYSNLETKFSIDLESNIYERDLLLKIRTDRALIKQNPLSLLMIAKGNYDSLETIFGKINNEIYFSAFWQKAKNYGYEISANNINLKDYLILYSNYSFIQDLKGNVNFKLSYDKINKFKGFFKINNINYLSKFNNLNANIELVSNKDTLNILNSYLSNYENKFLSVKGKIFPKGLYDIKINSNNFSLEDIFNHKNIFGGVVFNSQLKNIDSLNLQANLKINDFVYNNFKFDVMDAKIKQKGKKLSVEKFEINRKDKIIKEKRKFWGSKKKIKQGFLFSLKGDLAYNFLNNQVYDEEKFLILDFSGDLLSLINEIYPYSENVFSKNKFQVQFNIDENGLNVKKAFFDLFDASLSLNSQPKTLENIKIDFSVLDNLLYINDFYFYVGNDRLVIENNISGEEQDITLGSLNLGKLFFYTEGEGLLLNYPHYMPKGTIANLKIKGRNKDKAEIFAIDNGIKILADLEISNGQGIYPENTQDFLSMKNYGYDFSIYREKEEDVSQKSYDLSYLFADLKLIFTDNIYYTTYPFNLKVLLGSYIYLLCEEGNWSANELYISSGEGNLDILGTYMDAKDVVVMYSKARDAMQINGNFEKIAKDGTMISYKIYLDEKDNSNKSVYQKIKTEFSSDNTADVSSLDMIARLTYGKNTDELTQEEELALLQEKAINFFSLNVGSSMINTIVLSVQNNIRNYLKLDKFDINFGFIKNLTSNYFVNNNTQEEEELYSTEKKDANEQVNFTRDILLDNLKISLGKYILPRFFLEYSANFDKEVNVDNNKSEIEIKHDVGFDYYLPWKFNFGYSYVIEPDKKSHEVKLSKTIYF